MDQPNPYRSPADTGGAPDAIDPRLLHLVAESLARVWPAHSQFIDWKAVDAIVGHLGPDART